MLLSANMNKKFYITTPIYYPNANPHIGSVYSTVLADIIARYQRLLGKEVVFLTGVDEHGQKVFEAAKKVNKSPQDFVDEIADTFESVFKKWHISNTIFMRTTKFFHMKAVQNWIEKLQKKDYIYKSVYQGWYCLSAEEFLLEKDCLEKNEAGIPLSPTSGKPAIWITQEAYFFRLSAFEGPLLDFFSKNPDFIIPCQRTAEIINFIQSGLKDLCISRSKKDLSWGIPFPNDDNHVVYVWADALNNYITAIGYLQDEPSFDAVWPSDLHVMAKDIFRFHAIYWLAFLLASDLQLPKKELVHGWLLIDNQKMSKSLGNVIDPSTILEKYDCDTIRYYFSSLSFLQDADFNYIDIEQKHNSDLVDNLSNLLQRTIVLCHKKGFSFVCSPETVSYKEEDIYKQAIILKNEVEREMQNTYCISKVVQSVMTYLNSLNAYFHQKEPWKMSDVEEFELVMNLILHGIYYAGVFLLPIMPIKMAALLQKIGVEVAQVSFLELCPDWIKTFSLSVSNDYLFTKYISKKEEKTKMNEEKKELCLEKNTFPIISFDDFLKVVILVGEIIKVDDILKSEKLYYMTVDFGAYGIVQIASGIKQAYTKEFLLHKKSIFSFNLAPRTLCGVTSHGMLLMAKKNTGLPELIELSKEVANGTRVG